MLGRTGDTPSEGVGTGSKTSRARQDISDAFLGRAPPFARRAPFSKFEPLSVCWRFFFRNRRCSIAAGCEHKLTCLIERTAIDASANGNRIDNLSGFRVEHHHHFVVAAREQTMMRRIQSDSTCPSPGASDQRATTSCLSDRSPRFRSCLRCCSKRAPLLRLPAANSGFPPSVIVAERFRFSN